MVEALKRKEKQLNILFIYVIKVIFFLPILKTVMLAVDWKDY